MGVPYAIAAKFAWPNRVAIALVGDGAMLMNGINGLVTIAKYWKDWSDPRLIVLVLANHDLNQVTWEQRVMNGDAKFDGSQVVPDFHFARYAELLGLKGIKVNQPEEIGPAWDEALAATLPPHITFAQAQHFSESLLHDANRRGMFRGAMRDAIESLLPHKK
jgi:pyruvate dehydrogenase (quinone)